MNVIKSLVCTLEELGSLPRAEWHVKIRYHLPGQKFMGFGRVIFLLDLQSLGLLALNSSRPGAKSELITADHRVQANGYCNTALHLP